jgi:hypothetical protein
MMTAQVMTKTEGEVITADRVRLFLNNCDRRSQRAAHGPC